MPKRLFFCLVLIGFIATATALITSPTFAQGPTPTLAPIYVVVTSTPNPNITPIYVVVTNTPIPTATLAPVYVVVTSTPIIPTPANSQTAIAATATTTWLSFRDHFIFRRMFKDDEQTYWARNYSYGSTDDGTKRVHHGVDISNPLDTPVLAAGDGVIYYAGDDISTIFGPQPNFYGNVVVIQHPYNDANGQAVYSLYGHLSKISVKRGDYIKAGDPVGIIGAAGIAAGTHLHFEVRIGSPTDYLASRNPELWVRPYINRGVIAGRVLDADGNPIAGVEVQATNEGGTLMAYSYGDNSVNGDTILKENFVIADVPAGDYKVFVRDARKNQFSAKLQVTVKPDHSVWAEVRLLAPQ